MAAFEIRKLTEQDAAAWWLLRLEMLEREPAAFGSSAEDHLRTTVESTARRIASGAPDSFIVGVFHAGELAGVAGFQREQEVKGRHKGHIWGVYVRESSRGGGMGRALLDSLIAYARAEPGLEQVMLTVSTAQPAARRLYESLGFQPFGREPHALFVNGQYVDEDYMILMLG